MLSIAWLLSSDYRAVRPRIVAGGVALQVGLMALLMFVPGFRDAIVLVNGVVSVLERATLEGTSFIFGYAGGGPLPFEPTDEGATFIFAFRVLPFVVVLSALSAVLFYWGVLPFIIRQFARVLDRVMGISGALGFGASASIFFGTIESCLLVKPYLARMTSAELFGLMTCVMATVAGTVMVIYASVLGDAMPGAMGHIMVASVISVPGALTIAHLMRPATAQAEEHDIQPDSGATSSVDALFQGMRSGVEVAVMIAASIIVLLAMVNLANQALALVPLETPLTLQRILGWGYRPLVWLIGVPWGEAGIVGELMGTKTVLNELIAYVEFGKLGPGALSPRTAILATYALCGFANVGSVGILVSGLAVLLPERLQELTRLGLLSVVSGTLTTLMTAAVAGVMTPA